MALNDTQFQALKKQLSSKKNQMGEQEYSAFLSRAAQSSVPEEPQDDDGFVFDVGQGVAKSVGQLGLGLGKIGRSIQRNVVDPLFGIRQQNTSVFDTGSEANVQAEQLLERDTAGEKVGGFIGDVASFALPGGAAVKATKGTDFLTRAAVLGLTDAGVATARQGEFNRESVDAAIIGAAFPVAGAGFKAAKKALLPSGKEAGGKVVNSLIKPLLKDFSYGKNPGKAVAEAGITANSLDELAVNIGKARGAVGDDISKLVAKNTKRFDVTDSFSALDDAIKEAQKNPRTNSAILTRLNGLKDDLLKVTEEGTPTRKLTDLSANEVWELKQEIGSLTRWTGNATDDELVNKALKTTYGKLKGQLDNSVDGMSGLSNKYADLKSAEIATQYRDKIAARQGLVSFTGGQAGIATGLITAAATGGVTTPLLLGAGAAGLVEAGKSPAFKTRLAAWLASAGKEELQDAFVQAPWLRGALQTILLGEE